MIFKVRSNCDVITKLYGFILLAFLEKKICLQKKTDKPQKWFYRYFNVELILTAHDISQIYKNH